MYYHLIGLGSAGGKTPVSHAQVSLLVRRPRGFESPLRPKGLVPPLHPGAGLCYLSQREGRRRKLL